MDLLYSFDNFQNDTYFEIYSFFIWLLFKIFKLIFVKFSIRFRSKSYKTTDIDLDNFISVMKDLGLHKEPSLMKKRSTISIYNQNYFSNL